MAESAIDYLAIGHLAKDLTPDGPRLGGTAAYAALTARAFDYSPGVLSACGPELDLSPLAGIPLVCIQSPASTTFENTYGPEGRTQFKSAEAAPLTLAALPPAWRAARIVHLGPLGPELAGIGPNSLDIFAHAFVGLTPQGWMRQVDSAGRVRAVPGQVPGAAALMPQAGAVVISLDDLGGDWSIAEGWARLAPVVVVTQGAEGCTVFDRGRGAAHFSALDQPEVDPTGAGDIFAAAFFINLYETDDAWASARFANQVAALSVTRAGLEGVPLPVEVGYCRLRAEQA